MVPEMRTTRLFSVSMPGMPVSCAETQSTSGCSSASTVSSPSACSDAAVSRLPASCILISVMVRTMLRVSMIEMTMTAQLTSGITQRRQVEPSYGRFFQIRSVGSGARCTRK